MNKSILVISYYSNMPGACQAEWVDDRIFAFIQKGYKVSLISATCCFKHNNINILDHIRIPTLSPHGCRYEFDEIKRRSIPVNKFSITYLFLSLSSKVDFFLNKLNLKSGEGRWSWFLSSIIASIRHGLIKNKEFIYTTGGPASAHLTGILLAKLYGKKVICEFQDPLSGKDIGRNKLSQIGLKFFERLIIKHADITIYCTRNAMLDAFEKYSKYKSKISYVYPGANLLNKNKNLLNHNNANDFNPKRKIKITYLGSLYQTRNLDTLMHAIDELVYEGYPIHTLLEIHIYGNINSDIKQRIINFKHKLIIIHGLVDRNEAMQKAINSDVLLLIQNTDDRSVVTIPFKTYDYMHTGKLILGLTYRNDELENMLSSHGHLVCQANDIPEIKLKLKSLLLNFNQHQTKILDSDYTPGLAVNSMIQLINPS